MKYGACSLAQIVKQTLPTKFFLAGLKDTTPRSLRELINQAIHQAESPFTHYVIALVAYSIWKEQGCPEGRADEHWYQAMKRLMEGC